MRHGGYAATIGSQTVMYVEPIRRVGGRGPARRRAGAAASGRCDADLAEAALLAALVFAAMASMPAVGEVPERFSVVLPWRFRLLSLGMQALIRVTIGFGALAQPVPEAGRRSTRPAVPVSTP